MTMDGGLERLVRILHEFCICPPPPENPAMLYGLTPPSSRVQKPSPALNPPSFDKHARVSLFTCVPVHRQHWRARQRADSQSCRSGGDAGRRWMYPRGMACE